MISNIKPATELDFDNIKLDIINFFKNDPTFTDYNFEGSALNTLIDILAYNTNTNAYYANMIHNESFIDTAQKRGSVVSIAKELGYVPKSAVCSTAYVDISATYSGFILEDNTIITKGDSFSSSNETGTHQFIAADYVQGVVTNNTVMFSNVRLVSGTLNKNYFTVDTTRNVRSVFKIPAKNIDVSTISVYVKTANNSVDKTEFTKATNIYGLISTSPVYFIQESYDGYYEIYFGDDILGAQPVNGNIIEVEYIVVSTDTKANGCSRFTLSSSINGFSQLSIVTKQISFGGAPQESIESIRKNAIKNNSSKNRAVTANDYLVILKANFPFVKNCIVWGGEMNVPPIYGKVFISIQPVTGYVVTDAVKTDVIIPVLKNYSMLTIAPVIVDPEYMSVEFSTRVKFNRFKTTSDHTIVGNLVKAKIKTFLDDLNSFDTAFYQSELISELTALDPGIVSINIRKKVGFNITPITRVATRYERSISNSIVPGTVLSDPFDAYINNILNTYCIIKEYGDMVLGEKALGIFSIVTGTLLTTIGTVNLQTGLFKFNINVATYLSQKYFISIRCELVNDDILTSKNQILVIDSSVDTNMSTADNYVLVENYA